MVAEKGTAVVRSRTVVTLVPQGLLCDRGGCFLKAAFSLGHLMASQLLSMKLSYFII